MTGQLDGLVAVVTGGASGIGASVAAQLHDAGAEVAVLDLDPSGVDARFAALVADVSDRASVEAAIRAVAERFGRIDILVNNAGASPENPAEDVLEEDFDRTVAVNLKGTFFLSQAVGRVMIRQGSGRIVMIGSQAGSVALPGESVYCMTKAAIAHLTKCLALEWAPHGLTVNAVAPTFIRTPGTRKWLDDEAFHQSVVKRIPLGRVGEPADVAGAVVYLASPAAALVTGTTLMVDGGWTIQ